MNDDLEPERLRLLVTITDEARRGHISEDVCCMLERHVRSDMPLERLADMIENVVMGGSLLPASKESHSIQASSKEIMAGEMEVSGVATCECLWCGTGNDWTKFLVMIGTKDVLTDGLILP